MREKRTHYIYKYIKNSRIAVPQAFVTQILRTCRDPASDHAGIYVEPSSRRRWAHIALGIRHDLYSLFVPCSRVVVDAECVPVVWMYGCARMSFAHVDSGESMHVCARGLYVLVVLMN
jgi:hypothetical protein